jgi:hypothetical protein
MSSRICWNGKGTDNDYLKFNYVVDYVIVEGETSNTPIWFCCQSHDNFANYYPMVNPCKKYHKWTRVHIVITLMRTTHKHSFPP